MMKRLLFCFILAMGVVARPALAVTYYGNVVAPTSVTVGSSVFGTTSLFLNGQAQVGGTGVSTLLLAAAFNGSAPVLTNDGSGGFNLSVGTTSSFGIRFFTYNGATSTLTQLVQFAPNGSETLAGSLSVNAAATIGTNATISNNVTVGNSVLIQPTVNVNCFFLASSFSSTCPIIGNSNDGGVNFSIASTSTLGYRWFSYNGTSLTQLASLSPTGSLTSAAGFVSSQAYGAGFNDVLIFNSGTASGTTRIGSSSGPSIAGVFSTALYVDNGNSTNLLSIDGSGNVGIAGSYYSASAAVLKNHISRLTGFEALSWLEQTRWARFAYRAEHSSHATHVGFIADDSPAIFAGPRHNHMDVNAVAAADGAAIVELHREIVALRTEVRILASRR